MRSCDEILDWISAALDNQLNADEQAALEEHLAHCPACSALYDDLRTLQAATVDIEEIPAPTGFADAVMNAISANPTQEQTDNVIPIAQPSKARTPWKRWVASAAAVVIIAVSATALPDFARKSSNFDAATADTAADYNTAESAVMDQAVPESVMENKTSATYDFVEDQMQTVTYDDAIANEEVVHNSTVATSSEPKELVDSASEQSITYCGVLTLSDTSLPEGLDEFDVMEDDQGNLTYVVSAEYFFSTLDTINTETEKAVLSLELDDTDTDAEYGLIIVENPS